MKRVTGIGGIFFKCQDPDNVKAWYKTHLGLDTDPYGTSFEGYKGADASKKGFTQWSPFTDKTKEGNKIELWEPNDLEYDKIVDGRTK